jgi:tetratricopeptide (TPR) repeat protein
MLSQDELKDIAYLEEKFRKIETLTRKGSLKAALDMLRPLVGHAHKAELASRYESLVSVYGKLLEYAIKGVKDPERKHVYGRLLASVYELSDLTRHALLMLAGDTPLSRVGRELAIREGKATEEMLSELSELQIEDEVAEVLGRGWEAGAEGGESQARQAALVRVFDILLLTDRYRDAETALAEWIFAGKTDWHVKCVVVSAVTLSLIGCFDRRKFELLFGFATDSDEQVRCRAMTGLFFCCVLYDNRLGHYPDLLERLTGLGFISGIESEVELLVTQFVKSKETEKITKKLQEEIIPEVSKLQSDIMDKLDLENILSSDYYQDKNPDWEKVFDDTPDLFDKVKEITELQLEGADVFHSAFSELKRFTFFDEAMNWFMPFTRDNPVVRQLMARQKDVIDTQLLLDSVSRAYFLCNSDKYSFFLNVEYLPSAQKKMMMQMFNAEIENLSEITSEETLLNQAASIRNIYAQYLQDLYRFFKVYPHRTSFRDIFSLGIGVYGTHFFRILAKDTHVTANLAAFYFDRQYYREALDLIRIASEKQQPDREIFEKMAYCHQMLGEYGEALEYYRKAELYDRNRAWNLKKIAYCLRKQGHHREALDYYLEAEKLEPDNLYVQTYIGNCHLDLKDYETALKYYHKVKFLDPENLKVYRPIAWCTFMTGRLEEAASLFEELTKLETNPFDHINRGHVLWCMGQGEKAAGQYARAAGMKDGSLEVVANSLKSDRDILAAYGITPDDLRLMVDYVGFRLS